MALLTFEHGFLSAEACEAEKYRRSFAAFVRAAWSIADPSTQLIWNIAVDGVTTCLQAVTEGRLLRLAMNIPPGHGKSLIVSVLWPAWEWTRNPIDQAIFSSYEMEKLVMRDAVRTKDLTDSEWYRSLFRVPMYPCGTPNPNAWDYSDAQNTKAFSKNTRGGSRIGTSVGTGTGLRANRLVIDDPMRADDADSPVILKAASDWCWKTMSTRFNDPRKAARVIIMQRLHENDLSGEAVRAHGFESLALMSEFEPHRRAVVKALDGSVIWADPRTEKGQLLFPELFTREVLADLKTQLGPLAYPAQHQQDPAPESGGKIKREWFAPRWHTKDQQAITSISGQRVRPTLAPDRFDFVALVADCAFRKTETSDFVALGVFGLKGVNLYLIDLILDRLDFTMTCVDMLRLYNRWKPNEVIVEARANGDAVINVLKSKIPGLLPIEPEGGKESRIYACAPKLAAGNVWLPLYPAFTPSHNGVIATEEDLISQAVKFPKGANDDAIDMLAYAVNKYLTGSVDLLNLMQLVGQG
jgi:predicted phage terminase large subunit-like protein